MITAARVVLTSVLREARPQFRPRPNRESVRSDPDYPRAFTSIRTRFSVFKEKIDAAFRPIHSTRTVCKFSRRANFVFEVRQYLVEPD